MNELIINYYEHYKIIPRNGYVDVIIWGLESEAEAAYQIKIVDGLLYICHNEKEFDYPIERVITNYNLLLETPYNELDL